MPGKSGSYNSLTAMILLVYGKKGYHDRLNYFDLTETTFSF
jgi:hypothetical protein